MKQEQKRKQGVEKEESTNVQEDKKSELKKEKMNDISTTKKEHDNKGNKIQAVECDLQPEIRSHAKEAVRNEEVVPDSEDRTPQTILGVSDKPIHEGDEAVVDVEKQDVGKKCGVEASEKRFPDLKRIRSEPLLHSVKRPRAPRHLKLTSQPDLQNPTVTLTSHDDDKRREQVKAVRASVKEKYKDRIKKRKEGVAELLERVQIKLKKRDDQERVINQDTMENERAGKDTETAAAVYTTFETDGLNAQKTIAANPETECLDVQDTIAANTETEGLDVQDTIASNTKTEGLDVQDTIAAKTETEGLDVQDNIAANTETEGLDVQDTIAANTETEGLNSQETITAKTETEGLDVQDTIA